MLRCIVCADMLLKLHTLILNKRRNHDRNYCCRAGCSLAFRISYFLYNGWIYPYSFSSSNSGDLSSRYSRSSFIKYKIYTRKFKMTKNIGKVDKVARIVVGVIFIVLGMMTGSWLGLIGLIPIATAVLNWCPLYDLLKMNTCDM